MYVVGNIQAQARSSCIPGKKKKQHRRQNGKNKYVLNFRPKFGRLGVTGSLLGNKWHNFQNAAKKWGFKVKKNHVPMFEGTTTRAWLRRAIDFESDIWMNVDHGTEIRMEIQSVFRAAHHKYLVCESMFINFLYGTQHLYIIDDRYNMTQSYISDQLIFS